MGKEYDSFMFYESYKDTIERARTLYGKDEAATLCLEIIHFAIRRESTAQMRPELQAVLESIKPYIVKSQQKKEQTAARFEARKKRTQTLDDSASTEKSGKPP